MTKYKLPDRDIEFINSIGAKWESGTERGMGYVIFFDVGIDTNHFKVEGGGNKTNVLFMLPPGYPNSQIDMSSFYPYLSKINGQPIPNLHYTFYKVKGWMWQTWSRHRIGGESWNPETDGIASHIAYTDMFLQREVGLGNSDSSGSHLISTFVKKSGSGLKILKFPEKPKTSKLIIKMG